MDFILSVFRGLPCNGRTRLVLLFNTHYENQIAKYNQVIKTTESDNKKLNYAFNEYNCPDIFSILMDQMYLAPLWTGIMLQAETIGYENKTRLSNNPVENWFSQVKNNMLLKKKSSTSEIVSIFYKRLMAKYFMKFVIKFIVNQNKN